ncbi:hypothetical protein [Pseudorhodoplanes sp.]
MRTRLGFSARFALFVIGLSPDAPRIDHNQRLRVDKAVRKKKRRAHH